VHAHEQPSGDQHAAGGFEEQPRAHDDTVEDFDAAPLAAAHEVDEFAPSHDTAYQEPGAEHQHTEGEHEEDPDNVLQHNPEVEEDGEEASIAPEIAATKGPMARYGIPAFGVILGLIVLAGGYSFYSRIFGSDPVQTAQAPVPRLETQPQTGMPAQNRLPNGTAAPSAFPPSPGQPAKPQFADTQPARIPPPQPAATPPAGPAQQMPGAVVETQPAATPSATTQPDTAMHRPGDDEVMQQVASQIGILSGQIRSLNNRIDAIEKSNTDARTEIGHRMDTIDSRLSGKTPVAAATPVTVQPTAASTPAGGATKTAINAAPSVPRVHTVRRIREARSTRRRGGGDSFIDENAEDNGPPSKPRVIPGFALRGVSEVGGRSVALVRGRKGGLEEVGVGQSLQGAGEIRSIRQNGGRWVVVTTTGVIVE
jgi:hypothetical protein